MYELNQVSEYCFYIQCPAKIGLVKGEETDVCLIDSGNDREAGKKVRHILEQHGWTLRAIYHTHSHADHIGGSSYLQAETGCSVYASRIEYAFTRYPLLEPSFLYGACPFRELKHKFLMAPESDVDVLTEDVLPESLNILDLKGHFFDMVGFAHTDGVAYLADCLLSRAILDKYKIPFIYDVQSYMDTLEHVKQMENTIFIPSHADVTDDIRELAQYNMDVVNNISHLIMSMLNTPMIFEKILKELFGYYKLKMTPEQYVLVGSTIRSFLSYLKNVNKIEYIFVDNEMMWRCL